MNREGQESKTYNHTVLLDPPSVNASTSNDQTILTRKLDTEYRAAPFEGAGFSDFDSQSQAVVNVLSPNEVRRAASQEKTARREIKAVIELAKRANEKLGIGTNLPAVNQSTSIKNLQQNSGLLHPDHPSTRNVLN